MKIEIPKGRECNGCPFISWDEIYDGSFNWCNYYTKEIFRIDDASPCGFYTHEKLPQCVEDFGKDGGEFELIKKKTEAK